MSTAIWLWTILFRGRSCRPYIVGTEQEVTIAELAHVVAQSFRKTIEVRLVDFVVRKTGMTLEGMTNPEIRWLFGVDYSSANQERKHLRHRLEEDGKLSSLHETLNVKWQC